MMSRSLVLLWPFSRDIDTAFPLYPLALAGYFELIQNKRNIPSHHADTFVYLHRRYLTADRQGDAACLTFYSLPES